MTAHPTPTPTEPHHDVRDERARDVAWNGWIDDHRDHGSVTRELMAAFDAGWAAAVAARPAPVVSGEVEWGVRWNDVRKDGRVAYLACDDRAEAEEMIHNDGEPWLPETNPTLVRRTVTAWTVADTPAADDEGGQE